MTLLQVVPWDICPTKFLPFELNDSDHQYESDSIGPDPNYCKSSKQYISCCSYCVDLSFNWEISSWFNRVFIERWWLCFIWHWMVYMYIFDKLRQNLSGAGVAISIKYSIEYTICNDLITWASCHCFNALSDYIIQTVTVYNCIPIP